MLPGLFLGAIGGFAAARIASRLLHGGCGGHRYRGWRHSAGPASFRVFRLLGTLGLDRAQRDELNAMFHDLMHSIRAMRPRRDVVVDAMLESISAETFDRLHLEQEAARQGQAVQQVKDEVIDALGRLHKLLTPEQRAKLRGLLGVEGLGPSAGPYR